MQLLWRQVHEVICTKTRKCKLICSISLFRALLQSNTTQQRFVIECNWYQAHYNTSIKYTTKLLSSINFKTKCWHEKNNCCGSLHDKYKLHRTKIGISAALQKLLRNRNLNINRSLWKPRNNFTGTKKSTYHSSANTQMQGS